MYVCIKCSYLNVWRCGCHRHRMFYVLNLHVHVDMPSCKIRCGYVAMCVFTCACGYVFMHVDCLCMLVWLAYMEGGSNLTRTHLQ